MTTSNSFTAQGPGPIGFFAKGSKQAGPVKLGALAVGLDAGVYGATDDVALPPAVRLWGNAGVLGASVKSYGVAAFSTNSSGVWAVGHEAGVLGMTDDWIAWQGRCCGR